MRAKAREQGVYLRVLKNTLVRRAVADTPVRSGWQTKMVGPLVRRVGRSGCCRQSARATSPRPDDKKSSSAAGVYDGKLLDKAAVAQLASILVANSCYCAAGHHAPVSGFARALAVLAEK